MQKSRKTNEIDYYVRTRIKEMAHSENNTLSSAFKTFFERETLTGPNFNEWYRSLRIVLRVADTFDYLYKPCPEQPADTATEAEKAAFRAEYKKHSDVACIMLGKMSPALQRQFENYPPQNMLAELRKMFEKPPAVEIYDLVDALHSCKQAPGKPVSEHVLEMKGLMDQLHTLGKPYDNDMAVNLINRSLNKDFGDFVRNFNMHCVRKTIIELHTLLIDFEKGLKDKAPTPQVFTIQKGRDNKPYLQVGNETKAAVEAIGMFDLVLPSGLVLKLNNCYYAPSIVRGVCQKCVFNANHDACVIKFLKEVNSRAKVPSNKTTNRNKPVEQIRVATKPKRQIPKGHRFSIKKTTTVHEKTTSPRSCLRWQPTGRILKTVCLRWVPTGKTFASSTTKAPFLNDKMMSIHISSGLVLHQMTSDHNRSELGILLKTVQASFFQIKLYLLDSEAALDSEFSDHHQRTVSSKLFPKSYSSSSHGQLHHDQELELLITP
ncbi:hypothetical protein Tco_1430650 [Tanacetum coccineum]